jgi:hypothetical protein
VNPDAELLDRARTVLNDLRLLSEAPTARALDASPRIAHSKSSGGRPGLLLEEPLFDKHRRRLEDWLRHGDDLDELRELVSKAELDRDRVRYRSPLRVDGRGLPESTVERTARILADYDGWHYADAAAREGVSRTHLRRLRSENGRRPLDGARA